MSAIQLYDSAEEAQVAAMGRVMPMMSLVRPQFAASPSWLNAKYETSFITTRDALKRLTSGISIKQDFDLDPNDWRYRYGFREIIDPYPPRLGDTTRTVDKFKNINESLGGCIRPQQP